MCCLSRSGNVCPVKPCVKNRVSCVAVMCCCYCPSSNTLHSKKQNKQTFTWYFNYMDQMCDFITY